MHILIVGPRHVGKTTLINKIIQAADRPLAGFRTKKESGLYDPDKGHPVYIYDVNQPIHRTEENLVGYCQNQHPVAYAEIFDAFADRLTLPQDPDTLFIMDELGFMESNATRFCDTILKLFAQNITCLAAVKDKSTPFLDVVKSHPNCKCFFITEENRDTLLNEILDFIKQD